MCPSPHLWFLHAKQAILDQNFNSLWVPDLICVFCMQNSAFRTRISSLFWSKTSSVVLSTHNSVLSTRINGHYWFQPSPAVLFMQNSGFKTEKSLWGQDPTCGFCMQNNDFLTRITSLYGSQTWPVDLCRQNSVISTWKTSLYWSQPSSVVFACKRALLGPEFQVSMRPRPHLWFWAHITTCLAQE